jgi:sulfur relay (sulfurtransferase) DsrF/TusC family protein
MPIMLLSKANAMKRIILLAFFGLLMYSRINAQNNCDCTQISQTEYDRLIDNIDSTTIFNVAKKLKVEGESCKMVALNLEIEYWIYKKSLPLALSTLQNQAELINDSHCKQKWLVQSYLNFAHYTKESKDFESLSKYAFAALGAAEQNNDKQLELEAIKYIVHLFTRQNQNEKNWFYIKKAERLILSTEHKLHAAKDYNWLAFELEKKYTLTERLSLLDSAMMFAAQAKQIAIESNDYEEMTKVYRVYEANSYHRGNLKQAIFFIDSAIYYLKKNKVPSNPSALYFAKAWDYMDLKNYSEAQRWQDSSIYYAEKLEGRTPATMSLLGEATKLFEASGNLPKAYSTFKKYEHIKDSVFKIQRAEKISEMEQKYNKAQNELTIKELAQEKRIYLLLSLVGLLGVATIAFYLRQQSLKHRQNILETEQRLNRARMNPHFFFNALTSLQQHALQQKDGMAMASRLSQFSDVMRKTLESTYQEYITIEEEVAYLRQYLEIQKNRYPVSFEFEVSHGDDLEIIEVLIPPMIVQPFIENSIEHGLAGIDWVGNISVRFENKDEELYIEIMDNGKGLDEEKLNENEHISRATEIIKDRIYLLATKMKSKARFSVGANPNGTGVLVAIYLPLIHKQETAHVAIKT